jgi:neurotransmitter:Na+ symporter, NSS family
VLLGVVTADNLRLELAGPYEGYPAWFVLTFGWGAAAAALLFGLAMTVPGWRPTTRRPAFDDEEVRR